MRLIIEATTNPEEPGEFSVHADISGDKQQLIQAIRELVIQHPELTDVLIIGSAEAQIELKRRVSLN